MGLVTLLKNYPVPVKLFQLFRAFRILRLFGRLKSLKKIISALSVSLAPVSNAFIIMFIVIALYAIIGVAFLSEVRATPPPLKRLDRQH